VSLSRLEKDWEMDGMPETWRLMERLLNIQKRKRAFGGQVESTRAQTIRRRLETERRGERVR
jgi:hypothetical protein